GRGGGRRSRMKKLRLFLAPIIVAIVALIGLASCQGSTFRESIEGKLTASSAAALAAAGIDDAVVWFAGRDATVEAGNEAIAVAAEDVVQDVEGVRFVRSLVPDDVADPGEVAAADAEGSEPTASADVTDAGES